jgi:hypothetical protein
MDVVQVLEEAKRRREEADERKREQDEKKRQQVRGVVV